MFKKLNKNTFTMVLLPTIVFILVTFLNTSYASATSSVLNTTPLTPDIQSVIDIANINHPGWNGPDRAYCITLNYGTVQLRSMKLGNPTPQNWNGLVLDKVFSVEAFWGTTNYITFNNIGLDLSKNIFITKPLGGSVFDLNPQESTDYSYMMASGNEIDFLYSWQNVYKLNALQPEILPDLEPNLLAVAPKIDYFINDSIGTFTLLDKSPDEDYLTYFINYGGTAVGDPQFQSWQAVVDLSMTQTFNFEFPFMADAGEANIGGGYNIQAFYSDSDGEPTSQNTEFQVILRTDQINFFRGTCVGDNCGTISTQAVNSDFFSNCGLSAEFPFIQTAGCVDSIKDTFTILSFNRVKFNTAFSQNTSNCSQLHKLSKWLNLGDNYIVCPQFDEELRNDVSGILVFMLGIVGLGFLLRKRRLDF